MRSSVKFELAFVLAICVIFFYCAWILYSEGHLAPESPREKAVGTITYKNHIAERKANGQVLWNGVAQSSPVYNSDTVRTTVGSSAVIHLKDGTEISLGEGTMILVVVEEKRTSIGVSGGLVSVRRAAGPAPEEKPQATAAPVEEIVPLVMETRRGIVRLMEGSVSISDSASGTSVDVESGKASISEGSGSKEIGSGSAARLDGRQSQGPPLVPLEPKQGQTIFTDAETCNVDFAWTTGSGPDLPSIQLVVAADSEFKLIEYKGMVPLSGASHSLPGGSHYWKLSTRGVDTPPRWFNVSVLPDPRPLEPADERSFEYSEVPPMIGFSWVAPRPYPSYRLEVFSGAEGDARIFSETTPLSNLALDSLGEGEYHWRVVAIAGRGSPERPSRSLRFSVRKSRLAAPEPLPATSQDAGDAVVSTTAVGNGAFLASWREVDGADGYEAVVSRDEAGMDVVAALDTKSNVLRLDKSLEPGIYFVRVRARSGNALSDSSAAVAVRVVEPLPLVPLVPIEGMPISPSRGEVSFRWSDPNEGRKYRVVVSQDASFASPYMSADSTKRMALIPLPEGISGTLLWKVELLDDSGGVMVSSPSASFILPRLVADPVPIFPVNGERIDVNTNDSIVFRWGEAPGADEYLVTLYRTNGAIKSRIDSWTTEKTSISINSFDELTDKPYAWEVSARVVSEGRVVGQSRVVLSYFSIFQARPLAAPENVFFGKRNIR